MTALAQITGSIGGSAEALAQAMEASMGATTLNGHVTSNMRLANVSDLASMVGFGVTRHRMRSTRPRRSWRRAG